MMTTRGKSAKAPAPVPPTLYLVSDASGNLLEHLCTALLTQFPPHTFDVRSLPFLGSAADLPAVPGIMPRSSSKQAPMGEKGLRHIRRPSSATRSEIRLKTPPVPAYTY
jgi:hypothetical protein